MENVNDKIIIYQTADGVTNLEVKMDYDTVWLTQAQMVELFQTTKQNVSLHVNNVYKECELEEKSTVKEYLTVQNEGKRSVRRMVKYYNLDVIISVGYRVKSQRGTQFRIWANRVLKEYLVKGYAVNERTRRGGCSSRDSLPARRGGCSSRGSLCRICNPTHTIIRICNPFCWSGARQIKRLKILRCLVQEMQ